MSATSSLMVRKRGAKVNSKQKKFLLQSMADNPLIYSRKVTAEFTINHHKAFWRNMCAVLNVYGPPRKTIESWKKAWKDIRLRYHKMGVDLKEIISSLKCEHVVDTKLLLEKADQICTITRGKVDVEQALRDTILSEKEVSEFVSFNNNMDVRHLEEKKHSLDELQVENRASFNYASFNEKAENKDLRGVKIDKSDEDDLCEITYEEVLESDLDGLNDSDTMSHSNTSTKRKLDLKYNGFLSTDNSESDSELEVKQQQRENVLKRAKRSAETNVTCASSSNSYKVESNDTQNSSVLNSLLVELRHHNRIQGERLAFDKKCFETKKKLLEESLDIKKDLAKAQNLLAKSIKTFIDNISFNR